MLFICMKRKENLNHDRKNVCLSVVSSIASVFHYMSGISTVLNQWRHASQTKRCPRYSLITISNSDVVITATHESADLHEQPF